LDKKNIILYGLIFLSAVLGGLFYKEHTLNQILTENETNMITYYTDVIRGLEDEIQDYEEEINRLNQEKNNLNQYTASLEKKQEKLEEDNSNLTKIIDLMEGEISTVKEKLDLETNFQIGNSLTSFYEVLRHEYGLDGGTGAHATYKELDFAAKMISHDLGNEIWPILSEEYYDKIGNYSYIQAKNILDKAVSLCEINDSDERCEKLDKILRFISKNISYEHEINDISRAPVETLNLASGDCEDYSILAVALCEAAGLDAALASFTDQENQGHVMILVYMDDLGPGRWFTYYKDLHELGLKKGKWIIIEPQAPIDYQPDAEWLSQWDIQWAKEIT
jgi:hypothetical protein